MKRNSILLILPFAVLILTAISSISCTAAQDQAIRENVRVPGLQEGVQARDNSLETAVEGNIQSDLELRWYTQEFGIEVTVSTAVATVSMTVRNQDQHDRALALAEGTEGVSQVIDEIEIDPSLPEAPFEW